jgi:hypothetical protein
MTSSQPVAGAGVTGGVTSGRRTFWATAWRAVSATFGALMGLVPHVLHHVGIIAGAALVSGVGGNLLFGVLGLVLSVPLLRRLYRRFHAWKAPVIALAIFALMYALSAFVIGPAISGDTPTPVPATATSSTPSPSSPPSSVGHGAHHGG